MPRTTTKSEVVREVLIEAGYRCAVPTCRTILALDLHHIEEVKDGGPNEPSNLLALYGGPLCQDTKIGFDKSYFPPLTLVFSMRSLMPCENTLRLASGN